MKKILYIVAFAALFAMGGCAKEGNSDASSSPNGSGGSMARFAVKGDNLYAVTTEDVLRVFDITDAKNPIRFDQSSTNLQWGAETVYIRGENLFVGGRSALRIYSLANPKLPTFLGEVSHMRSCDPVVATDQYAYVTLNTQSSSCGWNSNQLLVYDVTNPKVPELKTTLPANYPKGLDIDEAAAKLFVCENGVKVYLLTDPKVPEIKGIMLGLPESIPNLDAYDVIANEGVLIAVAAEGLFQFDYTRDDDLHYLSKIDVKK